MSQRTLSVFVLLLHTACSARRPTSEGAGDLPLLDAQPPVPATVVELPDASVAEAGVADGGAGGCVHPAYQPGTCLNADGPLEDEAILGWFADRGVKVAEGYPGYGARCREHAFGPEGVSVLVCTTDTFVPGPLFANGPMGWHRDLRVLDVRNRRALELLRLPLALSEALHWNEETLFAARYEIDTAAGAVDLVVDAEDCERGRQGVAKYHDDWVATLGESMKGSGQTQRDQIAARKAQGRMDVAQVGKICRAAGHYVAVRGGRLERAK